VIGAGPYRGGYRWQRRSDHRRRGPRARADSSLRSLSVRPESRSSQARQRPHTKRIVYSWARVSRCQLGIWPSVADPVRAICLFLPCRRPRRARRKWPFCRQFTMARPGLEPGTPRFSGSRCTGSLSFEIPANPAPRAREDAPRSWRFRSVTRRFGTPRRARSPKRPGSATSVTSRDLTATSWVRSINAACLIRPTI
jgi:hypothetical protein